MEEVVDFESALNLFDASVLMRDCGITEETFKEEGKKIWNSLNQMQVNNPSKYQKYIDKTMKEYGDENKTKNPTDILKKKRQVVKETQNVSINLPSNSKVNAKPLIVEVNSNSKSKRPILKKGFLKSTKRKALYPNGSSEGIPTSLLQKCQVVDLSKV